ncbi:MAG TPA: hypothetical protein VE961_18755, partial [Pyrinomonadaceae bacterium]|nr:hypothetical protein [Pyrinomonadaceae bacterium]
MRKPPAIALTLLMVWVSADASLPAAQIKPQKNSVNAKAEDPEWEATKKRLDLHGMDLASSMWGLTHGYSSKTELDKAMNLLQMMLDAMAKNDPSLVRSIGGVEGFLNRFQEIMRSQRDDVVAGFAAKVLAVFGGDRFAPEIAAILKQRDRSWTKDVYPEPTVRGQAAVALSMIGAGRYKADIAALLRSMNQYDRSGALWALANLKATEYADDIARLLSKENPAYRRQDENAIHALIRLGAGDRYKKEIAAALGEDASPEANDAAVYALVHLHATEYVAQIAKLLDDRYRRGHAAKALAILGAREYASKIARMLDYEDDPLGQAAALLALGILEANEYAPQAAQIMRNKEKSYVCNYAEESLILMGNNDYLKEAAAYFDLSKAEAYIDGGDFDPLVDEEARQIHQRFLANLKKAKA